MRFSVIALLCLLPAFATCADTLRIAAENSWPPYSDARGLIEIQSNGTYQKIMDAQ